MLTLLITLDCVRADYLYGPEAETPVLDRLRGEAVTFRNAYAHSNTTLPSHVTLLTGLLMPEHGVIHNFYRPGDEQLFLADILREKGTAVGGFVGTHFLESLYASRLDGPDVFYQVPESRLIAAVARRLGLRGTRRGARDTLDATLSWLRGRMETSYFCWTHLFDTHMDYWAGEPYRTRYQVPETPANRSLDEVLEERGLESYHPVKCERHPLEYYPRLYKASISSTDELLGTFFDRLRVLGLWEEALVIVTADHGENILEHGVYCGHPLLFDETARVPLIVKFPEREFAGAEIDAPVGHEDVLPTILAAAEEKPTRGSGRDLGACMRDMSFDMDRSILTFHNKMFQASVRRGNRTWIENLDLSELKPRLAHLYEETGLFDGSGQKISDPGSEAELKAVLEAYMERVGTTAHAEAVQDEEIKEQLRGLGYME